MRTWPYLLAVSLGALATWVDFNAGEPAVTAPLLLVVAAGMGFVRPRAAWRWGLILGVSPFVGYAVAQAVGYMPRHGMPEPNIFASLLAVPFAVVGAYAGALARYALSAARFGH
jgi:hypothetical protein